MRTLNTGASARRWVVTSLALVGWTGMLLPFAYMIFYESRYGYALWSVAGFWDWTLTWLVIGVALVVLDVFRAKTVVERIFWAISTLLYAVAVFSAFVLILSTDSWLQWIYKSGYYFLSDWMQIEMFATAFLLTPLYVVFLSILAIRAWFLRLRHQ